MSEGAFATDKVRVLIIEDDPNNRIVVTRLLGMTGVKKENIFELEGDPGDFFDKCRVDLVLLDIQLPGKDGYAIIEDIRSNPAIKSLRVVALTANVMRQDLERAKEAGFDGFIGKPIDGRHFGDVFRRILAGESVWTIN